MMTAQELADLPWYGEAKRKAKEEGNWEGSLRETDPRWGFPRINDTRQKDWVEDIA